MGTGVVQWNARNRELFGVSHNDSLTIDDYIRLIPVEDQAQIEAAYRAAYRAARDAPSGGDFVVEHRTVADGVTRWLQARGRVTRDKAGVIRAAGTTVDITDLKIADDRRNLLLNELAHRAKNGILVMLAFVTQTAKGARDVKHFEDLLTGRLKAMADSQDLVTQAAGRPLVLTDLLTRALALFDTGRFQIDPQLAEIRVPSEMVVALALLLHELSTNAVKYGALSTPGGHVDLNLVQRGDVGAVIGWTEVGGPAVTPPGRRGFGTRLLDISLRNDGGHVEARFEPDGFRATIYIPVPMP